MIGRSLLALFLAGPALAAAPDRPTIFDLRLGQPVTEMPDGFAEFACGTNGGPPGRPLAAFADFPSCPVDDRGLREVYFRYDDEREYIARAMEQPRAVAALAGTKVFGIPVTVSALFDEDGTLRGVHLATDPRGVESGDRNDHWALARMLMHHFGDAGWTCTDLPPGADEDAVASYFVKSACRKAADGVEYVAERQYLHRRGESFTDEFGKVQTTHFVSSTSFEMRVP